MAHRNGAAPSHEAGRTAADVKRLARVAASGPDILSRVSIGEMNLVARAIFGKSPPKGVSSLDLGRQYRVRPLSH
jgi:hypothetical protein